MSRHVRVSHLPMSSCKDKFKVQPLFKSIKSDQMKLRLVKEKRLIHVLNTNVARNL